MRRSKSLFPIAALFILVIVVVAAFFVIPKAEPYYRIEHREKVLWPAESDYNYRCPGIVVCRSGALLAYCEKRLGTSDRTTMDVVCKRSEDNGNTWSDEYVLAHGIRDEVIMDNPVMVAGNDGRVHCFYTKNVGKAAAGGYIAYTYSDDEGVSWSEARDISESTHPDERGLLATGPGHGIQTSDGTLLIPIWYSRVMDPDVYPDYTDSCSSTLYSEDNGNTWNMGESICSSSEMIDPNECTLVELSDGRIMMNIRSSTQNYLRSVSTSPNGYSDWEPPVFDESLKSPLCFGSLCRFDDLILFASPIFNEDAPKSREKASIRISDDNGTTWYREKRVVQEHGGYLDINCSHSSRPWIYAVSEVYTNGKYSVMIQVFNKKWLEN